MKILANNIAILDEPDQLCRWVEESGKLCHDASVPVHYLPHINLGDVVIDVGAAIGDHTIAYTEKCGSPALVHAFECNPKMIDCLRHNCGGVHVYPFALSDHHGLAYLNTDKPNNEGSNFVSRVHRSNTIVPCVKLDSFRFTQVDFIKWDVEGFEVAAINGAADTLLKFKPTMIVEVHDGHLRRIGSSMEELERLIKSLGYSITALLGDRNERVYEALCQ